MTDLDHARHALAVWKVATARLSAALADAGVFHVVEYPPYLPSFDEFAADAAEMALPASDDPHAHLREVVAELAQLGVSASVEYPGVVAINVGDGRVWNTGMHGWDYASALRLNPVTGVVEPDDEVPAVDLPPDRVYLAPERVALAWAERVAAA